MGKSNKDNLNARARLDAFRAKQALEGEKATRRSKDNRLALLVGAGAVVLAVVSQLTYFGLGPGSIVEPSPSPSASNSAEVPNPELAENREWTGTMKINDTKLGLSLDGVNAPQAVANFISLAKDGYFKGLTCHRLTTEGIYVLQCGDPSGDGTGGPGYTFGPIENAPEADLYKKGYLAMARRGDDGNSMGSQFFIVYKDSTIPSDSAGGYTVFGEITSGLKGLKPIIDGGVAGGGSDGAPAVATTIGAIKLN